MNKTVFKRFGAYLIDFLFVFLLITMLNQIRVLNPTYEQYLDAYDEYYELYETITTDNILEVIESDEYQKISYDLNKYSVSSSAISLIVYLAYFVGFQKWNKNQTLGKKIFYLKVSSIKKDKVKWWQMLLRNVIVYNLWIDLILIVGIVTLSYAKYSALSSILSILASFIFWINVLFILFRKDARGLHDIIAGTKVELEK